MFGGSIGKKEMITVIEKDRTTSQMELMYNRGFFCCLIKRAVESISIAFNGITKTT
jgi:hypothetical protein